MNSILPCKRVLITGGAGFIGANLIYRLLESNWEINALIRPSTNLWRLKKVISKLKIFNADISDKSNLAKIITKIKPQAIIHLATYSQYRKQGEFEQMVETNIKGTLNLLEASKNINYEIFINTGSSSEYGIKDKAMKETDILEPVSFYAATKSSATLLCQVFSKEYNKPIVTLRPFSVYGPFEENNRFIPTITKAVFENKTIKITPGDQRRDFIYIDDIIDIYIKAISCGKKLSGQILNMGTGIEYTNDEVVQALFKIANKKVKIEKGTYPKRIWDSPHWVADITKTKKLLNWKPRFTLEQGLRYTYNWFGSQTSLNNG
jgi:nucleoside-diphosphate-sugar epimerase